MKKLKTSAIVSSILGVPAVFALILLYFALSDIADSGTYYDFEWYIAGTCIIILGLFTVSSIITLVLTLRYLKTQIPGWKIES